MALMVLITFVWAPKIKGVTSRVGTLGKSCGRAGGAQFQEWGWASTSILLMSGTPKLPLTDALSACHGCWPKIGTIKACFGVPSRGKPWGCSCCWVQTLWEWGAIPAPLLTWYLGRVPLLHTSSYVTAQNDALHKRRWRCHPVIPCTEL